MKEKAGKERYLVPGLVRGIEIMRLFSSERPVLTAPEIARLLDIPRSTVFRIAHTLEHMGLLEQRENGRSFGLGVGVLGIGFEFLASLDINEVARFPLERLSNDTGLATHLVIRDGLEVVVIQKVAGRGAFAGGLSVGTRLPAHATVLGRMILADLDKSELRALYKGCALKEFSAQTPNTLADLEKLLAGDRARGYAVSQSFFESGISAVAAPIRNASGETVAAINVTAIRSDEITEALIERVMSTASEISRAMGNKPLPRRAANF